MNKNGLASIHEAAKSLFCYFKRDGEGDILGLVAELLREHDVSTVALLRNKLEKARAWEESLNACRTARRSSSSIPE